MHLPRRGAVRPTTLAAALLGILSAQCVLAGPLGGSLLPAAPAAAAATAGSDGGGADSSLGTSSRVPATEPRLAVWEAAKQQPWLARFGGSSGVSSSDSSSELRAAPTLALGSLLAAALQQPQLTDEQLQKAALLALAAAGTAAAWQQQGEPTPSRRVDPWLQADVDCLLELKGAMADPPAGIAQHWQQGGDPCRQRWPYVRCTQDLLAVSHIDLSQLLLRINQLPELNRRQEQQQPQSAAPPPPRRRPGWTDHKPRLASLLASWQQRPQLPRCFQRLASLQLRENAIGGSLPGSWADLPQLHTLDLSHNALTGTLSLSWFRRQAWPRLVRLKLRGNSLLGALPDCQAGGCFEELDELDVSENSLSGPLPPSWSGGFRRLSSLDASSNELDGELPTNWASPGAFPGLVVLDLSNLLLTGPLPDSWAAAPAFPSLRYLALYGNQLGSGAALGPLPATWTQPTSFGSLQNLILFPGNHDLCTPGQPGSFTTVVGGQSSGGGDAAVGYTVVDRYFTDLNDAYIACYSG